MREVGLRLLWAEVRREKTAPEFPPTRKGRDLNLRHRRISRWSVAFLGALLLWGSACSLGSKRDRSREERVSAPEPENGDLVVCPECQGQLAVEDSTPFMWTGETHYFCRRECLREFKTRHLTARAESAPDP